MVRRLKSEGFQNLILRSKAELDLTRQSDVEKFFQTEKPEYVLLAAARVGGIFANSTYRAEFSYTNLAIEMNVIHSAWQLDVEGLLFFSSSCVYPRECPQPMREEYLFSGTPEPTNEPYAVAKLAGHTAINIVRILGQSFPQTCTVQMTIMIQNSRTSWPHSFASFTRRKVVDTSR